MIDVLTRRGTKLKWLGQPPCGVEKPALLIPFYNEGGDNFENRLRYFDNLAKQYCDSFDVILINDGSTDNSLDSVIEFLEQNDVDLYVCSVYPNAQKVGALFMTVLAISNQLVVTSDFDTDLVGLESLIRESNSVLNDPLLMGCYFRMLPFEGSGPIFLFQQLEYSMARSLYRIHRKERTIRVMPGAGSCYKREILISIYREHSGKLSGEDREAAIIGLKNGYQVIYKDHILALTRPPLSMKGLIRQRIRWYLGYLETFSFVRKYYIGQMARFSGVGILTLIDLLIICFIILLPIQILIMGFIGWVPLLIFLGAVYTGFLLLFLGTRLLSPKESREFKSKLLYGALIFPVFLITVEFLSWMGALKRFFRKTDRSRDSLLKVDQQEEEKIALQKEEYEYVRE